MALYEGRRSLAELRDNWRPCKRLYFTAQTLLTPVDLHEVVAPCDQEDKLGREACWTHWAPLRSGVPLRVMTT